MVSGATGLATAAALNWDFITTTITKTLKDIGAIVGVSLLALGAILVLSGAALPLGIGMLVAGGVSLASSVALNWNFITDKVSSIISDIGDKFKAFADKWLSFDTWKDLGNKALQGLFSGLSNIGNKIKTWGGNLIAGVKNFFGIKSPSRLFREEIGLNLGLGISKGIGDSERSIMSEVTRAGNMMRSALTVSDMPNNFSIEQATRNVQEITGSVAVRNDSSDSDNGSLDVVNAIYAMAQRIVTAIEENGGDIYVEADGTATQNRRNRMYGKTLQYI